MIDEGNVDNVTLLANAHDEAESQLHNLKPAVRDIRLGVNANEIEFMCFKQVGANFTTNGKLQKLAEQFV